MIDRQSATYAQSPGRDRRDVPPNENEAQIRNADKLNPPSEAPIEPRPSFDPPMQPDWHRMIAEAAYFHAEKRAFSTGHALDDWLLAEQEVKRIISS